METTDEEFIEDALSEPWRHAMMHTFNVSEHDDIQKEIEALRLQVDELHTLVIRMASALNTVLPVPIALEEQI